MANHPSAEKRARQSLKRRARARLVRGKMKMEMKKVDELLRVGNFEGAGRQSRRAESAIAKAASKGVIKRKQAQRIISRLVRRVAKAAKAASPSPPLTLPTTAPAP